MSSRRAVSFVAAVVVIALAAGCAESPRRGAMVYSGELGAGDALGMYMGAQMEQSQRQASLARRQQLDQRRTGVPDQAVANVPAPTDDK